MNKVDPVTHETHYVNDVLEKWRALWTPGNMSYSNRGELVADLVREIKRLDAENAMLWLRLATIRTHRCDRCKHSSKGIPRLWCDLIHDGVDNTHCCDDWEG